MTISTNKILIPMALITLIALPTRAHAAKPFIAVGEAQTKKTVIAIPDFAHASSAKKSAQQIHKQMQFDLQFMGLFRFLPKELFVKTNKSSSVQNPLKNWHASGAELLLTAHVTQSGRNLTFKYQLFDTFKAEALLEQSVAGRSTEAQKIAHQAANQIVNKLTGLPGIFLTKIVMVCERRKRKEVYTMNFDGTGSRRVTFHNSIALSPNWSPDGNSIAYSLYTKHKNNIQNIDLLEVNLQTKKTRFLSKRKGINSGASYHPDGRSLAMTMSYLGNPEIFNLNLSSKRTTRITKSSSFDVDPVYSPDGRKMAFVSSRTGRPMIFTMPLDGSKKAKRLTFAGRYNASPTWSPQDNKIAFAGWIDGRFDVFIMNPDGTNIERLTKNQGNNEDPNFSPDGNFLAFTSDRTGRKNVYVMNLDGTYVKRITYGLGKCATPKWSPVF